MKKDLRDLTHAETRAFAGELGVEPYRGDQIFRWVHGRRVARVEAMTDLAKDLRARVADAAEVRALAVDAEQVSKDGTRKLRLRTADDRMIETVLIPDGDAAAPDDDLDENEELEHLQHALFPKRPKLTQCVSSQVGCALDCSFCATAKLGFGRQLSAGEIVDQVYRAQDIVAGLGDDDPTRRAGADRVTNLVFMGMGEPLHNYKNVIRALEILTDPAGADFSRRRITVSTAGLVPGIEKLAAETATALRVNLAVSLNATTDEVRDVLMPINKKWNIATLLEAAMRFPLERRRRVTFEYVLLAGVNDSDDDARALAERANAFALRTGRRPRISVLDYNAIGGADPFARSPRMAAFRAVLSAAGLPSHRRYSGGSDVAAACGQLAGMV